MKRSIAVASLVVVTLGAVAVLWPAPSPLAAPETVHLAAALQDYRPAGEFRLPRAQLLRKTAAGIGV